MTDAASDDPIEMIATLARDMTAERRGRFLDVACGGDVNLRAEVEARLRNPGRVAPGITPWSSHRSGRARQDASGSSRCGIAVPHTTGSFSGDTRVRHEVLGVVPTPRTQRGAPFAPRGPEGPFPRFNTNMGRCDSLPSISPHFVSFAWRYHRFVPRSSPSASDVGRGSSWSW